jgi:hypothetical protein
MTLRTRLQRLEAVAAARPDRRLTEQEAGDWQALMEHPEGPALVAEWADIMKTLEWKEPWELRQQIIFHDRGRQIISHIARIQSGVDLSPHPPEYEHGPGEEVSRPVRRNGNDGEEEPPE